MFAVIENTPGYLPESEGGLHLSIEDALADAGALHAELEEEGYRQVDCGSQQMGTLHKWYYYQKDENDLGRMVTIEEVEV